MKKKLKTVAIILACIILVLFSLNPSLKSFKEYLGFTKEEDAETMYRRTVNGFIFSIYETDRPYQSRYFAMLGNFWEI